MAGKLDWKWIGIGVLIMVALSIAAGFALALILGPQLREVSDPSQITLSSGQMLMVAVFNVLAFLIGGFIVGVKSAGRTIIEPGISAAIAVLIGLLISGNFSIANLIVGGLVPFAAGVAGGWLGERRQGGTV
jgi:ribose transport system permease protein